MRTRSQRHAQVVHGLVSEALQLPQDRQKRYGALCHRFPIMVLRNGLAQAIGFLAAKAGGDYETDAHGVLLRHLAQHLGQNAAPRAFQNTVHSAPLGEYRHLTREALAASVWFKRYAESLFGVDASAEGNTQ